MEDALSTPESGTLLNARSNPVPEANFYTSLHHSSFTSIALRSLLDVSANKGAGLISENSCIWFPNFSRYEGNADASHGQMFGHIWRCSSVPSV